MGEQGERREKTAGRQTESGKPVADQSVRESTSGRTTERERGTGRTTQGERPAGRTTEREKAAGRTTEREKAAGRTTEREKAAGRTTEREKAAGRTPERERTTGRTTEKESAASSRMTEREKRRRREMIARRKRIRRIKLGIAAVALLLIVMLAFLGVRAIIHAVKGGNSKNSNTAVPAGVAVTSGKTGSSTASASGQDTQGAQGAPADQQGAGDGALEEAAQTESAADAANVREEARILAMQYDYDGAIALLEQHGLSDQAQEEIQEWESLKASCVAVDVTRVPHVFFHSLINDDRAFQADLVGADRVRQNNAAMTTTVEFDNMIQQMYEAGYVVVGLDDMCVKTTDESGTVRVAKNTNLMLPPDKKPFVLSIDDLSYYHSYGIGTQGYATKMIVDENGKPKCVYTNENGETSIGDYDVVPRMDTFIENHPDFSYHGARGTVAMTGYNGVFGYRTNNYYKDINDPHLDPDQIQWLQEHPDFDWEQDCKDAKAVADAMKAEGWTFASHTYGHLNAESSDLDHLMADHERWKTVNEPILGKTDKIIFAFGADIGIVGAYTPDNAKFQYFKNQGFNIFCNVDGNIGWTEFGDTFMRTGRVALDGFTMYQAMTEGAIVHSVYAADYEQLGIHDVATFFNPLRPTPIDSE